MEENKNENFNNFSEEIEQINREEKERQSRLEYDDEIEEKPRKRKLKKNIFVKLVFCFFGVLLLVFGGFYALCPSLSLKGKNEVVIEYNDKYEEKGYKASFFGNDLTNKVYIESNLDINKVGDYIIKYMVRKNRIVVTKERKVSVVDSKKPEILLEGEAKVNVCPNKEYEEVGFTASDNYDGDLTSKVEVKKEETKITYTVKDTSGNTASATRELDRSDTTPPVVTVKGSGTKYITVGSKYSDEGATAVDNCDDDISANITTTGSVDASKVGTYELTYTVSDKAGNEGKAVRKVVVSNKVTSSLGCGEPGVIYLTFDDGPGPLTKQFLDILDKYNVKATFFVTNQFPAYQNMIAEEHKRGHKVALHTYTHDSKWSFYYGVDKYFADFDKMNAVIEKQTGSKTKLFRFPGGASNTVSCNRGGAGIMTKIVQEATNRGYTYFDWNISSGDAGGTTDPNQVYKNVVNSLSRSRGNVILMHDIHKHTLNAIERIVKYGVDNGYTFKTIDASVVCKQKLAC